jgi:hypothetical protein
MNKKISITFILFLPLTIFSFLFYSPLIKLNNRDKNILFDSNIIFNAESYVIPLCICGNGNVRRCNKLNNETKEKIFKGTDNESETDNETDNETQTDNETDNETEYSYLFEDWESGEVLWDFVIIDDIFE